MPVYEYICLECHEKFDSLRAMSEADAPIACDACGGNRTSRTLSVFYTHTNGGTTAAGAAAGCACSAGGACACSA